MPAPSRRTGSSPGLTYPGGTLTVSTINMGTAFTRILHGDRGTARAIFAGLALALAFPAMAQTSLPKDSPFLPSGTAAVVGGPGENLEFAGVSVVGKRTDLILLDKTTKKNRWIGIGDSVDGITVVTYDPKIDQAVVRRDGVQRVLVLRRGAGSVNLPAAVAPVPTGFAAATPFPPPTAPQPPGSRPAAAVTTPPPATPTLSPGPPRSMSAAELQTHQETEARMLVSDLLEIGMVQRRAYEAAQSKAAREKASTPAEEAAATPADPATKPNG